MKIVFYNALVYFYIWRN